MSIYRIADAKSLEKLFENWQETMVWSCLQGVMGSAWADREVNPKSAQIVIADFCFFAGEPDKELVLNKPEEHSTDFIIMVPQTNAWGKLIEQSYKDRAVKVTRYAVKKEPDLFDIIKLNGIAEGIREPFRLQTIDENIYQQIISNRWSHDLCSQFRDFDDYKNRGIGVAVTDKSTVVSGASSYTVYNGGIEIEIDTREDYRRKGLAAACGAKLILECIKKGLYPSWDAQNKGSLKLAEKLGYHFDKEYEAYEVSGY